LTSFNDVARLATLGPAMLQAWPWPQMHACTLLPTNAVAQRPQELLKEPQCGSLFWVLCCSLDSAHHLKPSFSTGCAVYPSVPHGVYTQFPALLRLSTVEMHSWLTGHVHVVRLASHSSRACPCRLPSLHRCMYKYRAHYTLAKLRQSCLECLGDVSCRDCSRRR